MAHQEAGRPLPRFSSDDYVDWCVMEAVIYKASLKKNELAEEREANAGRKRWQQESGVKTVTAKPPPEGW